MTTTEQSATYTCPYCRVPSAGDGHTCPHCGAPVDVRERVSKSGWAEQPAIRDMARIHFGRSTCQISGKYVPVADMALAEQDWVFFSHHVLLHTAPSVKLDTLPMAGGWNRMLAGMPLVMMTAMGPGHIAISHDSPGETIALPLQQGQAMDVTEHHFLVGTGNLQYAWHPSNIWYTTQVQTSDGNENETHYPMGMMVDRFTAQNGPALLLLHASGNVFIRDLAPDQHILIQPSSLIYKDPSVRMWLHFEYPAGNYWFSSARYRTKTVWLALAGPGRIAMRSVYEMPESVGWVVGSSGSSETMWDAGGGGVRGLGGFGGGNYSSGQSV